MKNLKMQNLNVSRYKASLQQRQIILDGLHEEEASVFKQFKKVFAAFPEYEEVAQSIYKSKKHLQKPEEFPLKL